LFLGQQQIFPTNWITKVHSQSFLMRLKASKQILNYQQEGQKMHEPRRRGLENFLDNHELIHLIPKWAD
jgi:hypothetical protein